jgi:hypothetical protein
MPDRFSPDPGDQSFERFGRRIARAQQLRAEIAPGRPLEIWSTPRWNPDGRSIDWTPSHVADDVPRFEEIGVGWLRVGTLARSLPELLDDVREYAEVLPLAAPEPGCVQAPVIEG